MFYLDICRYIYFSGDGHSLPRVGLISPLLFPLAGLIRGTVLNRVWQI